MTDRSNNSTERSPQSINIVMNHITYQSSPANTVAPRRQAHPLKTILLVFCGSLMVGAIPILYALAMPTQTAPIHETVWSPLGK